MYEHHQDPLLSRIDFVWRMAWHALLCLGMVRKGEVRNARREDPVDFFSAVVLIPAKRVASCLG